MKRFDEDGLSFDYPDEWALQREDGPEGWTVTLQSPGTAWVVVRLDRTLPATEEVASAALAALREDYPSLEARPSFDTLAGEVAFGHDVEFFSLDLVTTCRTRAFDGLAGTVFVLSQVADVDEAEYEPQLNAILASMRSEED